MQDDQTLENNNTRGELVHAIEALLFAAGAPMAPAEIVNVFTRLWSEEPSEVLAAKLGEIPAALADLAEIWRAADPARGFTLVQVAEGYGFRSNARYAHVLRSMRDEKPFRLSKAALETLAIIAYRQPVTKPEVDHIRGVDCGGTVKVLLDRNLVRIVGKKEEPGRPLLYGTTREFLSFFNLAQLTHLPSLREFHELNEDSQMELREFEGMPTLRELSESASKLRLDEEPAVALLDEAMRGLVMTEVSTRDALLQEGIAFVEGEEAPIEPSTESSS